MPTENLGHKPVLLKLMAAVAACQQGFPVASLKAVAEVAESDGALEVLAGLMGDDASGTSTSAAAAPKPEKGPQPLLKPNDTFWEDIADLDYRDIPNAQGVTASFEPSNCEAVSENDWEAAQAAVTVAAPELTPPSGDAAAEAGEGCSLPEVEEEEELPEVEELARYL